MDECIGLAVIALDETEAFHRIEELDCALGLFAGQGPLRRPLGALDGDRLAFDPKVGRRNPAAAVYQRELERLSVGKIGQARLLDGGDMDENVLAAVVADDESETLLGIEELHDALAFADDLGRHSAACAATSTAAAETSAAAGAAAEAAAITASESATIAKAASGPESAAIRECPSVRV
jgi:hypothetical protein